MSVTPSFHRETWLPLSLTYFLIWSILLDVTSHSPPLYGYPLLLHGLLDLLLGDLHPPSRLPFLCMAIWPYPQCSVASDIPHQAAHHLGCPHHCDWVLAYHISHLCVDAFLPLPSSCDRLHSGNRHRWTPFSPCFGSDCITATPALALGTFSNRFGPCVTPSQTPSPPWSPFLYSAFLYLMTLILNYSGRGEACFIQE